MPRSASRPRSGVRPPRLPAVLAAIFSAAAFAARAGEAITVSDLRSEDLRDPLGIDARTPRFSWKIFPTDPAARGTRQSAYRVLAASAPEILAQDRGDLWDSGQVSSSDSVLVEYRGKPLASGTACWWKVRVWDERGAPSAWSEPARFTMGLLEPSDWDARWIGSDRTFRKIEKLPPEGEYLADPWLRKTFELPERPVRATAYVASVGYHELYVNGAKASDAVLSPCVSDHKRRARYATYEIAPLLRSGRNAIGLWLGTSWSIFPPHRSPDKPLTPIAIARIDVELPGGRSLRFATDETWRTHPSPSALLGVWMFMDFGGEYYDAAKEIPEWCSADFDDSSWTPATVYAPKLLLSAQMVEPNRCVREIRPVAVADAGPGAYRVDMGVNFAGFVEIDVRGKPGDLVQFLFSEAPEKSMTHNLRSAYRIGPAGRGTFSSRFNYAVGRWIEIRGLSYRPALEDVRGWLVRTDYRRAGWFACSNPLLERIYEATLWTFENLSLGGYLVDCPQRERMGYGGDGHATLETGLVSYELGPFYAKWSEDWRDVQSKGPVWGAGAEPPSAAGEAARKDAAEAGNLPYTAPTYWGGGGPAWSGFCVTMPWEVYEHRGDRRILEANLPTIERWLAFLETKARGNLLRRWGGEWDFLGDWLWPGAKGVNGDTRETLFFNNCYWVYNLETAARIARVLGRDDLAQRYAAQAEEIRRAIHAEFYVPGDRSYANGFQAYLAIALLTRIPPEEIRPSVLARFEEEILVRRKGHFWGGITGGYFIVKALVELGRSDLLFAMATKEDYPGWGDMLRRGATTLWESWEGKDLSLLHSSYLHIGAWFVEGLAGIRPDPEAPGYRRFRIEPWIPEGPGLEWVQGRLESPYGTIRSSWRVSDGRIELEVSVPANSEATVLIPARDPAAVTESGRPAAESAGVRPLGVERGRATLLLAPGTYRFEAPAPVASRGLPLEAADLIALLEARADKASKDGAFEAFEKRLAAGLAVECTSARATVRAYEENDFFVYAVVASDDGEGATPSRLRRCLLLEPRTIVFDDSARTTSGAAGAPWRLGAASGPETEGRRFRAREGAFEIVGV
ncbi:MAG: family 78 glycoside hydrolase catalytic domain, partial [Planctomycetota bacterium]